jgi:hypothetical protein
MYRIFHIFKEGIRMKKNSSFFLSVAMIINLLFTNFAFASGQNDAPIHTMYSSEKNTYTYAPVYGGFERTNGSALYTRPLYSSHINDGKTDRYIFFTGDKPKVLLSKASSGTRITKFAHMFLGIKDGKWLDQMQNIISRYVFGHEEYEITDASFDGKIKLTMVRPDLFDGLIVKAELPDSLTSKFVVASACSGGVVGPAEFSASEAEGTQAALNGNSFAISKSGAPIVCGISNIGFNYAVKDSKAYNAASITDSFNSNASTAPMVLGTSENNTKNEIYFLLTTEDVNLPVIQDFAKNPETAFDEGIEYFKKVSEKVSIDTPDPYLNSTIAAQVIGMDASWSGTNIMHGPFAWYVPHAGWRSAYGETTAGFGDRVTANASTFFASQKADGRITDLSTSDKRYNMGEVMVDQLMYNWMWNADLDFMKNGGYDFIKKFLSYEDSVIKVPGTNLYENWLNAWNTDNKWSNGGAGTIASVYNWRAYKVMSDIAQRLGKTDDAATFKDKADIIKSEMKSVLWDGDKGVYGEYKDRFGYGMLHNVPDLSSIYTPIDLGITGKQEAYQMLRFGETSIDTIKNLPRNAVFPYSSNWLPLVYSSDGIYPDEVINNVMAYYRSGQPEKAYAQFKGVQTSLFKGEKAGPGTTAHMLTSSGENNGHIDFADVSSQIVRAAVEGTFGIMMNMPDETVNITPGLLPEWHNASISTDMIGYTYSYTNNTETFNVKSEKPLVYKMSVPVRGSKISDVKVNGTSVPYSVTSNVEFVTDKCSSAVIEIIYQNAETAHVSGSQTGAVGSEYQVSSNGIIKEIIDPQGIIVSNSGLNSSDVTVTFGGKKGNHTFFVSVQKDDIKTILPVDVELRDVVEIKSISLNGNTFTFSLKNNSPKAVAVMGNAKIGNTSVEVEDTLPTSAEGKKISITADAASVTPGNILIKAELTGDYIGEVTAEYNDWKLSAGNAKMKTINLDDVVNQNLTTLHSNSYDITYNGDNHYVLPRFYFVRDTTRSVTANGRSWWESGRGANASLYTPVITKLPQKGGVFTSDIGVPFMISDINDKNAAFVSLYNQFPKKLNIPVETKGSKVYFMLSVSTNHMQSYVNNAKITVNTSNGSKVLSLVNPLNIDDWLNYQTSKPYANSGYIQSLGTNGHSNILAMDLGEEEDIQSVDIECTSNEVLCGLLGMTVASA